MLVRIILLIILFFVSYTVVNALFRVLGRTSSVPDKSSPGAEVGKMVKCCECGTYVPESEIVRRNIHGEAMEFCSHECLQEYQKENDQ
ncbi:MAG: PP0621 family protein [Desulfuromonadaceae bacterium]|nr:hypothetical protein [Geobacteraceae bacterium]